MTIILYLLVAALFIAKYSPRVGLSPLPLIAAYIVAIVALYLLLRSKRVTNRLTEQVSKITLYSLLALMVAAIGFLLWKINPLDIRVDRWSATTYFLQALFNDIYPYGVHTHVSETNFPSPFPMWHYLMLPFFMLGDVGLHLIVVLIIAVVAIHRYTDSYRYTLICLLLLALSPAYWWEVAVRSDGLSNMLLTFCLIMYIDKRKINFDNSFTLLVIVCAIVATTRLSAVIPMAVYLFPKYLKTSWQKMLLAPLMIMLLIFIVFMPYIFWDTDTWIFFSRNPLMSQSYKHSIWMLLTFIVIAILISLWYKTFRQYTIALSWFLFVFMGLSSLYAYYQLDAQTPMLDSAAIDISYQTLSLPFAIYAMTCHPSPSK